MAELTLDALRKQLRQEMGRAGGLARAKRLSKAERVAIAKKASKAAAKKRQAA